MVKSDLNDHPRDDEKDDMTPPPRRRRGRKGSPAVAHREPDVFGQPAPQHQRPQGRGRAVQHQARPLLAPGGLVTGDYLTHVVDLPTREQLFWVRTRVQQSIDDLNEIGEPDETVIKRLRAVVRLVGLLEDRQ